MTGSFTGSSSIAKLSFVDRFQAVSAVTLKMACSSTAPCEGTSLVNIQQAGRVNVAFADDAFTVTIG